MAKWSRKWKRAKDPAKQRKYRYNAPLHIRHKLMAANLSKELRQKYKRRSFPIRKGDKVKVMVGKFKGTISEVEKVDLKKLKVYLKDVQITKKDGTKTKVPIPPSNLQIISLNLEDKKRIAALERAIKNV